MASGMNLAPIALSRLVTFILRGVLYYTKSPLFLVIYSLSHRWWLHRYDGYPEMYQNLIYS